MAESTQRVIKRYANRKLYDMSESCYITHDEIAALVERGEDVHIIDNRTKEDLTSVTLTQILFEKERKEKVPIPLATLRGIFQSGGDFFQRHIAQPVTNLADEAGEGLRKVFKREDLVEDGAEGLELESQDEQDAKARPAEAFKEWMEKSQRSLESLQKTLEDRWTLVVKSLGQTDGNQKRIEELEQRVAELERIVAGGTDGGAA